MKYKVLYLNIKKKFFSIIYPDKPCSTYLLIVSAILDENERLYQHFYLFPETWSSIASSGKILGT